MESVYEICFYGGLVLAVLSLITAVVLFVILKIPKVYGELTGRTQKKAIEDLKAGKNTNQSVSKGEQAKYYNQGSGKIKTRNAVSNEKRTANRDNTTDLLKPNTGKETKYADADATEVLGNIKDADEATDVLASENAYDDEATDVLASENAYDDEATDVLASGNVYDDEATDVLTSDNSAEDDVTSILTSDEDSTTVLTQGMTDALARRVKVSYNIVVVHTDEDL